MIMLYTIILYKLYRVIILYRKLWLYVLVGCFLVFYLFFYQIKSGKIITSYINKYITYSTCKGNIRKGLVDSLNSYVPRCSGKSESNISDSSLFARL